MAVWTTPITWSNGGVTALTMNTEIRDHLTWLKGFADLITASTAADSGTATRLAVVRAGSTDNAFECRVSGDTNARLTLNAGGTITVSHGNDTLRDMFQYHSNSYMNILMPMVQSSPMRLYTKNGALTDSDVPAYFSGSLTGMLAFDTSNNRLYVRAGASWRYVATV